GGPDGTASHNVSDADATPGIFTLTMAREWITFWATGLGPVQPPGDLQTTSIRPSVTIGGAPAAVTFSGLAPGWVGLYQVNVQVPSGITYPAWLQFQFNGYRYNVWLSSQP